MRRILFMALQILWGFPQTLLGLFMYLYWLPRAKTRYLYHGAIVTEWTTGGGISLGLFVFVSEKASRYMLDGRELTAEESKTGVRVHEYGHCIQSLFLGPLYLILMGIPSTLWGFLPQLNKMRREKHRSYFAFFTERWANALGERVTGCRSMEQLVID